MRRGARGAVLVYAFALALPFLAAGSSSAADLPSGERQVGKAAIEPAYNADTGQILYLLTPEKAPFPSKANPAAVAPLYLVEYPPGTEGTFNCMGVPGNCPDHDGLVATLATQRMPGVYGTDPSVVPGHDHIVDPPGKPDFNVAWEVYEVLFTSPDAVSHLTTDSAIDDAIANGDAIKIDLGFAFNCSVVSSAVYAHGTPIG